MMASSKPSRCDSRLTMTELAYCPTILALLITELTWARTKLDTWARMPALAASAPSTSAQGKAMTATWMGLSRAPMPSTPAPVKTSGRT